MPGDRTLIRATAEYRIVKWEAMPYEAPVPAYFVLTHHPRTRSIHPTFTEALRHADAITNGQTCPLLQPLPLYEEPA